MDRYERKLGDAEFWESFLLKWRGEQFDTPEQADSFVLNLVKDALLR